MFSMFDEVRVVNHKKQLIKEGFIVGLTSQGARIHNPRACHEPHYTDLIFGAEWFAFDCTEYKILPRLKNRKRYLKELDKKDQSLDTPLPK